MLDFKQIYTYVRIYPHSTHTQQEVGPISVSTTQARLSSSYQSQSLTKKHVTRTNSFKHFKIHLSKNESIH